MTGTAPAGEDVAQHLPPAGVGWMLRFYDPMSEAFGITQAHDRLLVHAAVEPGQRVLDVGCGTGAMALRVKRAHADATVVGIDPDDASLSRARSKADARGLQVQLDIGYGGSLPYPDATFDRVVSAFAIHHLIDGQRQATLAEMRRVLTPHGSLHLLDFGRGGHLPTDLQAAGFARGRVTHGTVFVGIPVTVIDASP